jgi:hypothetical protein
MSVTDESLGKAEKYSMFCTMKDIVWNVVVIYCLYISRYRLSSSNDGR